MDRTVVPHVDADIDLERAGRFLADFPRIMDMTAHQRFSDIRHPPLCVTIFLRVVTVVREMADELSPIFGGPLYVPCGCLVHVHESCIQIRLQPSCLLLRVVAIADPRTVMVAADQMLDT